MTVLKTMLTVFFDKLLLSRCNLFFLFCFLTCASIVLQAGSNKIAPGVYQLDSDSLSSGIPAGGYKVVVVVNEDTENRKEYVLSVSAVDQCECGICFDLAASPRMVLGKHGCSKIYCSHCLSQHFKNEANGICPICRLSGTFVPIPPIEKMIGEISVKCPRCNQEKQLVEIADHLTRFCNIVCQGCDAKIEHHVFRTHLGPCLKKRKTSNFYEFSNEQYSRIIDQLIPYVESKPQVQTSLVMESKGGASSICPGCKKKIASQYIKKHTNICSDFEISCKYCYTLVKREDLGTHYNECNLFEYECRYDGCNMSFVRGKNNKSYIARCEHEKTHAETQGGFYLNGFFHFPENDSFEFSSSTYGQAYLIPLPDDKPTFIVAIPEWNVGLILKIITYDDDNYFKCYDEYIMVVVPLLGLCRFSDGYTLRLTLFTDRTGSYQETWVVGDDSIMGAKITKKSETGEAEDITDAIFFSCCIYDHHLGGRKIKWLHVSLDNDHRMISCVKGRKRIRNFSPPDLIIKKPQ